MRWCRRSSGSFDYCSEGLAKVQDSGLAEKLSIWTTDRDVAGGRDDHDRDRLGRNHHSTAASYLRLNNILPPTAKPKP